MKNKLIKIESSTFALILPVWRDYLWPDRKTLIEPFSVLKFCGGFNMDYKNRTCYFFSAKNMSEQHGPIGELMGVVSGHGTEAQEFRLRGLYIFEKYRNHGVARALVQEIERRALLSEACLIWTLPRKANLAFYVKQGFTQITDWSNEYEFGPNCVAAKHIGTYRHI